MSKETPRSVRLIGRLVGPITRSTLSTEPIDPEEEARNDALHWIWNWRLQLSRLRESTSLETSGDDEIERRKSSLRTSYDEHALAVVGLNLARSLKRAEKYVPPSEIVTEYYEAIRLLRNLYEHWDDQRPAFRNGGREKKLSGKEFSESFPDGQPWAISYDSKDWYLGKIVPVFALTRSLEEVEKALLERESQQS